MYAPQIYNIGNGALKQKLTPHVGEVTGLVYFTKPHNGVISVGIDRTIAVHSDYGGTSGDKISEMLKRGFEHERAITCVAWSEKYDLIATGSVDFYVRARPCRVLPLLLLT